MLRSCLLALPLITPLRTHAESPEWIALGVRVHGGFGPFIPLESSSGGTIDLNARLCYDRRA
jgi:hypothetical protein